MSVMTYYTKRNLSGITYKSNYGRAKLRYDFIYFRSIKANKATEQFDDKYDPG